MKKYRQAIVMGILALSILFFIVLNNTSKEEEISEILPNVKIMEISTSVNQEQSEFVGFIQPKETYQGTFSISGIITNVFVVSGQHVKRGTVLMSVSDKDAQKHLVNAQQGYNDALINQEQAELLMNGEAMNVQREININQNRIEQTKKDVQLLEKQLQSAIAELENVTAKFGETSSQAIAAEEDVTQLSLQVESTKGALSYQESEELESISIANYRLESAISNYEASTIKAFIALNNVNLAQQQVEQTKLVSQIDGYVTMIFQEEKDLATPLMPSVVVASHEKVAVITLSQSNVNRISVKSVAQIITESVELEGLVSEISYIPDKTSRTYEANVDVGLKEELTIGEEVQVIVELEETVGTWIDISLLKNDGQDYVYVISANKINKRMVERLDLRNNLVLVNNLDKGDLIVVEGYRNLRVGDKVNVVGESDE